MTVASESRRPLARATAVAVCLYALVLAVGPALHHDLACHVKSSTHCTTCLVSVTAPGTQGSEGLVAADGRYAGTLAGGRVDSHTDRPVTPLAGRSPPA